jgi:hypothetical protein
VILAQRALNESHAGLREFVVGFPEGGGECDGGDLGGFGIIGGLRSVFEVGDALGGCLQ